MELQFTNEAMCAAEIMAATIQSQAEMHGMISENNDRQANGQAMAYCAPEFNELRDSLKSEVERLKKAYIG